MRLRLVTAQRGGELQRMRWADVDLWTGWWTIPGTVAKNKMPHRVPLSPTAVTLLKALAKDALRSQGVQHLAEGRVVAFAEVGGLHHWCATAPPSA